MVPSPCQAFINKFLIGCPRKAGAHAGLYEVTRLDMYNSFASKVKVRELVITGRRGDDGSWQVSFLSVRGLKIPAFSLLFLSNLP